MPAADAFPIQSLADGTIKWSDGSVTGEMSTEKGYVSNTRMPGTTVTDQNYQVPVNQSKETTPAPTQSAPSSPSYAANSTAAYNAGPSGDNMFWDAADGWKPINGGGTDAARQAEEARIRGIITSGFNDYENRLKGLIPQYQQSMDTSKANLAKGYESIFGGLQSAKDAGLANLATNRQQVEARKVASINDIQNNMRDVIRASQMKLGAMGAGDSSASEMMAPFAFTKLAGDQSTSVQNQANQQFFEIDKQVNDTKNMYNQLVSQSEQDKLNKTSEIEMKYDTLIKDIQERMALVPKEQASALANLAQGFASQRIAELSQIAAEDRAMKQQITTWATNRMSQLNDYKLSLSQSSSFDPRSMVYNELTPFSGGDTTGVGQETTFWNPQALRRAEDQLA